MRGQQAASRSRWLLAGVAGVTLVLYVVPFGRFALYPLLLLSTLVHEAGHGLAALLVGGSFESLVVFADGSGVARTATTSRAAAAFVAAGGLVGPALLGGVLFGLARWQATARWVLVGLGALVVVGCLTVVANPFGWIYSALVAAACLYIGLRRPRLAHHALVFLATQLALSVYSRSDYLFTRWAETAAGRLPSDVELMSRALPLPYWVWGAGCAAFSLAVLVAGLIGYLRVPLPRRSRTPRPRQRVAAAPLPQPAISRAGEDSSVDAELEQLRRNLRGS